MCLVLYDNLCTGRVLSWRAWLVNQMKGWERGGGGVVVLEAIQLLTNILSKGSICTCNSHLRQLNKLAVYQSNSRERRQTTLTMTCNEIHCQ